MKTDFEIPYDRYALIAELAQRSSSLGRTALQKKIYLLQALFDMKLGYDFSLYTYGPFTSEILSDLDAAEAIGAVRVNNVASGYGGYEIKPGEESSRVASKAKSFLDENRIKLDQLFNEFGDYNAKDLELRATIVFVDKDLKILGHPPDEVLDTVREIKPGFSIEQIKKAATELAQKDYIRSAA